MSYGDKKKPNLDTVLSEYRKISQAPTFADLYEAAGGDESALRAAQQIESRKRYKSIDQDGNIWIIQNPASWALQAIPGQTASGIKYRAEPKMVMTCAEGIAAAKSLPANTTAISWGGV